MASSSAAYMPCFLGRGAGSVAFPGAMHAVVINKGVTV